MDLERYVADLAEALMVVDSRAPVARNIRTGSAYRPGIGPHSEAETVKLLVAELALRDPETYAEHASAPYPKSRQKVDAFIQPRQGKPWAVEFKLLRLLGDNGRTNDNMLMHILSPYPQHRSAFTDCQKLWSSGFNAHKAVVILAYDAIEWPVELAIEAFEGLARQHFSLSRRYSAGFQDLIHPVHRSGKFFAWEIQ